MCYFVHVTVAPKNYFFLKADTYFSQINVKNLTNLFSFTNKERPSTLNQDFVLIVHLIGNKDIFGHLPPWNCIHKKSEQNAIIITCILLFLISIIYLLTFNVFFGEYDILIPKHLPKLIIFDFLSTIRPPLQGHFTFVFWEVDHAVVEPEADFVDFFFALEECFGLRVIAVQSIARKLMEQLISIHKLFNRYF